MENNKRKTFLLDAGDGIEHIITITGEEPEGYLVETFHRFQDYEINTKRLYNKCLFEELLSLGLISPL